MGVSKTGSREGFFWGGYVKIFINKNLRKPVI